MHAMYEHHRATSELILLLSLLTQDLGFTLLSVGSCHCSSR